MTKRIDIARVYDPGAAGDGRRVLVDRLWPRGVAKAEAPWDEWLKDAAPSTDLRRWYRHDGQRFTEFQDRYRIELDDDEHRAAVERLRLLAEQGGLVLLTATKDIAGSHVPTLVEWLKSPA